MNAKDENLYAKDSELYTRNHLNDKENSEQNRDDKQKDI